jgi:hypothetical protein
MLSTGENARDARALELVRLRCVHSRAPYSTDLQAGFQTSPSGFDRFATPGGVTFRSGNFAKEIDKNKPILEILRKGLCSHVSLPVLPYAHNTRPRSRTLCRTMIPLS